MAETDAGADVTRPKMLAMPTSTAATSATTSTASTSALSSPPLDKSTILLEAQTQRHDGATEQVVASDSVGFLTRRLRSAIGQDLVEDVADADEARVEIEPRSTTSTERDESPATAAKAERSWSTFLSVPFTGLSLTDNGDARRTKAPEDTPFPGKSAFTTYAKALDVRRWLGSEIEASAEAGPSTQSQPASKMTSSASLKSIPAGSFPSSSMRRRASQEPSTTGPRPSKLVDVVEHDLTNQQLGMPSDETFPDHEFLVLSTAGKPIFSSQICKARLIRAQVQRDRRRQKHAAGEDAQGDMSEEDRLVKEEQDTQDEEDQMMATRVGLVQALISNYAEQGHEILNAKSREYLELPPTGRIRFLLKPPLYLVAIAQWDEADLTLKSHLEYLYYGIISLLSVAKLNRLFDRAANFDLKRLLQGTDSILDALLSRIQRDTTAMRGTLQPLRIDAALRHDAGAALIPTRNKTLRPQDALYCLLLTRNGLITVARASSHSIHPIDCQLLINTVYATKALKEGGGPGWVPICLPKFAPQGFVYAHVSFLDDDVQTGSGKSETSRDKKTVVRPELGIVLVTGNPDGFDEMSAWRARIVEKLQRDELLSRLWKHIGPLDRAKGEADSETSSSSSAAHRASYSADELGLPGLRHFCFKWRANVQSTSPLFEETYEPGSEGHRRLLYLYGLAHEYVVQPKSKEAKPVATPSVQTATHTPQASEDTTPARSPSPPIIPTSVLGRAATRARQLSTLDVKKPAAMHVLRTEHEAVLAWNTQPFELAIAASPHMSRPALLQLARAVAKWVKQEEHRLFIVSAPVF